MEATPLQNALQAGKQGHATETSEYRGAVSARKFGESQEELGALRNGCGIYDLGFRARISLTGADRVRWLNGMVTNNIRDLAAGHGVYAFLLNPQGRILGDLYAFNLGDSLVVETDSAQVEKILAIFDQYIIMDDVEAANISKTNTTLGIGGPNSRAVLNAAGIEVALMRPLQVAAAQCNCNCGCLECMVLRGEDTPQECYEIWVAPKDVLKTWDALIAAGALPVGNEALEKQRVAAGIPLYGVDIRDRDLPQETEQLRALNFNKGCYVGQEIVERIRSRGNVHRTFTGFVVEGTATIPSGAKVVVNGKEAGEVTSSSVLDTPAGKAVLALGYIRREFGGPGHEVSLEGARGEVIRLPFDHLAWRPSTRAMLHTG